MSSTVSVTSSKPATQDSGVPDVFKQIQMLQKQEMQLTKQLGELQKKLAGKPPDQDTFNLMMALTKQIAAIKQEIKQLEAASLQDKARHSVTAGRKAAATAAESAATAVTAAPAAAAAKDSGGATDPTATVGSVVDTTA